MRIRYVPVALAAAAALALPAAPTTPAAAGTAPPAPRQPAHAVRPQPAPAPAPPTPKPAPKPAPAGFVDHYVQRIATSDRVVFITIDDGTFKDPAFLARVRRTHLPVSVFLTNAAASGHGVDYFRALQSAGAVIEDHTLHHPYLTKVSSAVRREEVCGAADRDLRTFGRRAQLLRPPYGAWDTSVLATAKGCRLHALVGWDAVMPEHGGLQTWNGGGRLKPGDIVLLHFLPGLDGQIARLLATIRAQHLRVALLEDYL